MYTEKDYNEVDTQYKLFIAVWIVLLLGLAVCTVLLAVARKMWLGVLVAVITGIAAVMLWGLFGSRLRLYREMIWEILEGSENRCVGSIVSAVPGTVTHDGVDFYMFELLPDERYDNEPARQVYYDVNKGQPPFKVGDHVELVLFGNKIKEC